MIRFRSRIGINGANPYLLVGAKVASQLKKNWRGPLPVRFLVSGKSDTLWRINLMPVGNGTFYLYLNGEIRKASNLKVGDLLTVDLQFDDEYKGGPLHPMPTWFGNELRRNPLAQRGWDHLTPSRQKEILRYFARLKSVEAKQRNLRRVLHVLAGGRERFMARLWNATGIGGLPNHGRRIGDPSSKASIGASTREHRRS
jgi:hypothetical protein